MDRAGGARPSVRLSTVTHPSTPGTSDARRVVVGASLVFALLLVAGGLLILWGRHVDPRSLFSGVDLTSRLLIGTGIGALAAALCALVVWRVPRLVRLRRLADQAVEGIEPRWHTIVIVSLLAGISEEFFFRGVLESVINSWFCTLAFVLLHGGFKVRDRGAIVFFLFLVGASTGLSALNAWKGLECAMAAHTAYDLVMFTWLARPRTAR